MNTARMRPGSARVAIGIAALIWAGIVLAATATPAGQETSLPQASRRISNWALNGNKGIWVEAVGGQWYYGEFLGPCTGVGNADAVAFRFNADGSLNRFSHVLVRQPRHTCAFKSFVSSAAPPGHERRHPFRKSAEPGQ